MLRPMLYLYAWFLLPSLFVFYLTIKYPLKAIVGKNGNTLSDRLNSNLGSGKHLNSLFMGAKSLMILFASLIISVLLIRYLGSSVKFIYGLITFLGCFSLFYKLIAPPTEKLDTKSAVIALIPGFILGESWLLLPSWETYNIVSLALAYTLISTFKINRLRLLLVILISFILFDAIAVWGIHLTPEVAQAASTTENQGTPFIPPLYLVVPNPDDITKLVLDPIVLLGLGDIVVPGVAILATATYRLHWWVIGGYILGIILALILAVFMSLDIPVLVLTNPLMIIAFTIGAKLTGKIPSLIW